MRAEGVALTDLLTRIEAQPPEVLDAIAKSMDVRAAEPAMQSICASYMGDIVIDAAKALEVGCGNGAATKLIMQHVKPATLLGIDPCSMFVNMASEAFKDDPRVSFALGDAASTGQSDASFDLVIAHTVYSHLLDPKSALTEAWRVLKPGGQLVIFDGDFATLTMALFAGDPMQAAIDTVLRNLVHAPYIMRQLPTLVSAAGFRVESLQPYAYVQTTSPDYLLTLLSRGTTAASQAGEIGLMLVDGFKWETERRIASGTFYGALLFLSLTARKTKIANH